MVEFYSFALLMSSLGLLFNTIYNNRITNEYFDEKFNGISKKSKYTKYLNYLSIAFIILSFTIIIVNTAVIVFMIW